MSKEPGSVQAPISEHQNRPVRWHALLDLLYGMFSHAYTLAEIRQMVISNPFDPSETPRQFKLVDFTDWLEVLVS